MKRTKIIRTFLLLLSLSLLLSACSGNRTEHENTNTDPTTKEYVNTDAYPYLKNIQEDMLPKIPMSDYAMNWRIEHVSSYRIGYPYVSIVAFDEETAEFLKLIPELFEEYKDNFYVEIREPSPDTDLLMAAAISDDPCNRLKVAQNPDCPDELIAKIASDDPDIVVRGDAIGNILDRRDFPVEHLLTLAHSDYPNVRLAALVHDNRTPEIIQMLLEDPDPAVRREANFALGNAT